MLQKKDELDDIISRYDMIINKELFKRYFQLQSLSDIQENLSKTQNTQENKKLVQVIKSGLLDLNKEIKNMSEDEIKIEKQYEIVDAVADLMDLMDLILFLTCRIILNISSKNTKLLQMILLYKFM